MKKTFKLLSVLMLALAVVGCENDPIDEGGNSNIETPEDPTEQEPDAEEPDAEEPTVNPTEPESVALFASLPANRTTLNHKDFTLSWATGDQLAVFNTPTGIEDYSGNLHFKIDEKNLGNGRFAPASGVNVPFESGVNYDWFVCLPYRETNGNPELASPKGQSAEDGYFPIGAQTQNKYNNSDHIKGTDIMVGKATNTRKPEIALKHLAVLHKFTVTNDSDNSIVINKLTLNGGTHKLFGTFWVDLTAEEPAIDINKANASFEERALTVKNGTELAKGKSADFYMITAPFTLNAGDVFKITIETNKGTQTLEKTAPSTLEFKAGTYNTANLVYDYVVTNDHLYYETFTSTTLGSISTSDTNNYVVRWTNYDKLGLSVYDGIINDVAYTNADNATITPQIAASALKGMEGLHARIGSNKAVGTVTVEGIKLHGYNKLNLSLLQTYKNSQLFIEYSVDKGATWAEVTTWTNPATLTCEERSVDFEVAEGSEVIYLRFTSINNTVPRIDNIKLTWQE